MIEEEQRNATLIGAIIVILLFIAGGGYYIWTKVKEDSIKIPNSQAVVENPIN